MTGLFNYPMYMTIKNVFGRGDSFHYISSRYAEEEHHFRDIDALGLFVDNHDNGRFLAEENFPGNIDGFQNAVLFSMTARGIPFFYYGGEFGYKGGNDPANRETLWVDLMKEGLSCFGTSTREDTICENTGRLRDDVFSDDSTFARITKTLNACNFARQYMD